MNSELQKFIEQNINLIENNWFPALYNKVSSYSFTRMLSEVLLQAGINPMYYLPRIPNRFLYESNLDSVYIPEGVECIGQYAFADCTKLEVIKLPEGLQVIEEGAFMYCANLRLVELPSTLNLIEFGAFEGCNKLSELYFRGTIDQWLKVHENDDSLRSSAHRIVCSDGTFDFE